MSASESHRKTDVMAHAITDRVKRSAPRLVGEVAVGNERSRHPDEIRIARRNDCVREDLGTQYYCLAWFQYRMTDTAAAWQRNAD